VKILNKRATRGDPPAGGGGLKYACYEKDTRASDLEGFLG
jgi:hypothetical protein